MRIGAVGNPLAAATLLHAGMPGREGAFFMNLQWYPGHMAKARRLLSEQLKKVDVVVELCDARAPAASRNPDLDRLCQNKKRLLVLNKADLANPRLTRAWLNWYEAHGVRAVAFKSTGGAKRDVLAPLEAMTAPEVERMKARGVNKVVRGMVIGVPNVGKSTFINRLYGSAVTKASDRPGVTRANQWVRVSPYLEMLDTPGMLWPKLEDQRSALLLACLGTIRDEITDQEGLAAALLELLLGIAPEQTATRFKLKDTSLTGEALLEEVCRGRGFLLPGGMFNCERAASIVLDEFRSGKVPNLTIEQPPISQAAKRPATTARPEGKPSVAAQTSASPINGATDKQARQPESDNAQGMPIDGTLESNSAYNLPIDDALEPGDVPESYSAQEDGDGQIH